MFVREFYGKSQQDLFQVVQAVVKDEKILEKKKRSQSLVVDANGATEEENKEDANADVHRYSESTDTVTKNDVNIDINEEAGAEETPRKRSLSMAERRQVETPTAETVIHQMQKRTRRGTSRETQLHANFESQKE